MPEQERQAETEQDEQEATIEQPLAEASITDDQSEEVDTATVADEEDTTAYDDIGEVEGEAEMRDMIGYIARVLVDDNRLGRSSIRLERRTNQHKPKSR